MTAPAKITPGCLWRYDGRPYAEAAEDLGITTRTIHRWAKRWGFKRIRGDHFPKYTHGPCVQCGAVHPSHRLGGVSRRCPVCKGWTTPCRPTGGAVV